MINVSQTVHSMMKRDLEKKRKSVAKATAELKAMEDSFKQMKPVNLRKAK